MSETIRSGLGPLDGLGDQGVDRALGSAVATAMGSAAETVAVRVAETVAEVKPRMRGWLHLGLAPLTLAAGIVLVALSPTAATRLGAAAFGMSALVLFSVSAIYHTFTWSPRMWAFWRRFDHANVFLLIAGSYTPLSILLLSGTARTALLTTVWTGAVLGMLFRVWWTDAPRWLYVPLYIALGWAAVFFLPAFLSGAVRLGAGAGVVTLALVVLSGVLYTVGGAVYGFQRPNPWPRWFGFHEVFHTFTVLAFAAHYTGVLLATCALR